MRNLCEFLIRYNPVSNPEPVSLAESAVHRKLSIRPLESIFSAPDVGARRKGLIPILEFRTEGKYFMSEQWNNFFIMVGGGAAALAGLIFVAMSINPEIIIRNTTHKNRAINMLTGFTAVFMACSFALIGNQYLGALGLEWLALWILATAIFIRGYVIAIRSRMSSIGLNVPRLMGGTMCYVAEVVGASFLILGYRAGLYIAAIATIVLFGFLISGAWLLMIGAYEDQASDESMAVLTRSEGKS